MTRRSVWLVEVIGDALRDVENLSRPERMNLYTALDKLTALGPQLCSPHMKSLQGEPDLFELRPQQGRSPVRAIYVRVGDSYKVLVVCTKSENFTKAVSRARARAAQYRILDGR